MAKKRDDLIPDDQDRPEEIPLAEDVADAEPLEADEPVLDLDALGDEPALADLAAPAEEPELAELAEPAEPPAEPEPVTTPRPGSSVDLELPATTGGSDLDIGGSLEAPSGASTVAWASLVEASDSEGDTSASEVAINPPSDAELLGASADASLSSLEVVDLNDVDAPPLAEEVPLADAAEEVAELVADEEVPLAESVSTGAGASGSALDLAGLLDEPVAPPSGSGSGLLAELVDDEPVEAAEAEEAVEVGEEEAAAIGGSDIDLMGGEEPTSSVLGELTGGGAADAEPEEAAEVAEEVLTDDTVLQELGASPSSRDIVAEVESGQDLRTEAEAEMMSLSTEPTEEAEALNLSEEPAPEAESIDLTAVAEDEVDLGASGEQQLFQEPEQPAQVSDSAIEIGEEEEIAEEEPAEAALEETVADEPDEEPAEAFEEADTTLPFQDEAAVGEEEFEAAEALKDSPPEEAVDEGAEAADDFEAAAMEEAAQEDVGGEPLDETEGVDSAEVLDQEEEPVAPKGKKEKPARKGGALSFVLGSVIGLVVGAGAVGGAGYVMGWGPGGTTQGGGGGGGGGPRPPFQQAAAASVESVHQLLGSGDVAKAAEQIREVESKATNPDDPKLLAARGETRWFEGLQELAKANKAPTPAELQSSEKVKQAEADLEKAKDADPDAAHWLGVIAEMTGQTDKAREIYQAAMQKFPNEQKRFQAALDSLDRPVRKLRDGTLLPRPGNPLTPLTLIALQPPGGQQPPPDQPQPMQPPQGNADQSPEADKEAGYYFWKAVKLAQKHEYKDAVEALQEARKIHDTARFGKLRKAQNPLTDPTENIFLTACDELADYWQARQRLLDAGLLKKDEVNDSRAVLAAISQAADAKKSVGLLQSRLTVTEDKLKESDVKLKDALAKLTDFEKELNDTKTKLTDADKKLTDTTKKLTDTEKSLTEADARLAAVAKVLKTSGSEEPDLAKAVTALDKQKVAAETELKAANANLDAILGKLAERKYLAAGAKRGDIAAGLDKALVDLNHPVVAAISRLSGDVGSATGGTFRPLEKTYQDAVTSLNLAGRLADREMQVTQLGAELHERWTPQEMLEVWRPVLQLLPDRQLAERALKDVERANRSKPTATAAYVKGLAERSMGDFDAARATLAEVVKNADQLPEPLRKEAKEYLKEITEPGAFFVPEALRARDENRPGEALGLVENALKIFPQDRYPKEHASLLAIKGVLEASLAAEQPTEKRQAMLEDGAKVAEAAAAAGQKIEGHYALGKVAEARGDYAAAEDHFRQALKGLEEAKAAGGQGDEAVRQANPASDLTGNRYRWAMGQAVMKQKRQPAGTEPVPAPAPKPQPPLGEGGKPSGLDGGPQSSLPPVPGGWQGWLLMQALAADPQACPLPLPGPGPAPVELMPKSDPRADELLAEAEKMIAAKDNRGYLLKGQALALKGRWTEGLRTYVMGLDLVLKDKDYAEGMRWLMDNHPAFKRPDPVMPPDVAKAEEHYARGLRYYFSGRFPEAEIELKEAARLNDFDPKAVFFLGLTELQQGRRDQAEETFRLAARTEQRLGPQARADVSVALERVQGPARKVLNAVREKAGQPGGL